MSAYGTIALANRPVDLLPSTRWDLPQPVPGKPAAPFRRLVLHHLRLDSARALPGPSLLDYTHRIFAAEIEAGRTYPQEAVGELLLDDGSGACSNAIFTYTRAAFEAYFWAADVIVAVGQIGDDVGQGQVGAGNLLEASRAGRSWEDALVGFYYVKPNYPGGLRIFAMQVLLFPCSPGIWIWKDFGQVVLALCSSLGYKASVFNLVYANNTGSLRIWDSLGFTRAGLIPRAGRLRRADGNGEEWVDSVIYYRSFVDEEEWARPIDR
ncbi:hypothetical protein BJV77DRAFT_971388 [Russula vinacea]|nr:hypothetical protein BJV77DRAFT_971388 [Russula vinacea]